MPAATSQRDNFCAAKFIFDKRAEHLVELDGLRHLVAASVILASNPNNDGNSPVIRFDRNDFINVNARPLVTHTLPSINICGEGSFNLARRLSRTREKSTVYSPYNSTGGAL